MVKCIFNRKLVFCGLTTEIAYVIVGMVFQINLVELPGHSRKVKRTLSDWICYCCSEKGVLPITTLLAELAERVYTFESQFLKIRDEKNSPSIFLVTFMY